MSEQQTIIIKRPPAASLKPGTFFRGLLIHSKLGEGGMGAAYLASHPVLKMPLVVKTFKVVADESVFREAQLAARVSSPNVVGVVDAGEERGVPFLVQRYIDGVDLDELSRQAKLAGWRIPVNAVCRMLLDAARGIHAVHQAGVLHRDVKPANLFLQGSGDTAVGDFGIATDVVKDSGGVALAGTPHFMAPEQWAGGRLSAATDIYALGVTAHLIATGGLPFRANTLDDLRHAHISEPYVLPASADPREAYLFSVVEKALRKRPEDRYQTGEALARVLSVVTEPAPHFVPAGPDAYRVGAVEVTLAVGDLSAAEADVIVSASNQTLVMNVGVSAALRRAAGAGVEREAVEQGPCAMGDVIWTGAGRMRARWMAHAVAALNGAVCLQRATLRALLGAEVRKAASVAFPALGTGVGDVPMDLAAKLMLDSMATFAALGPTHVRGVHVVLREEAALSRWRAALGFMCAEGTT